MAAQLGSNVRAKNMKVVLLAVALVLLGTAEVAVTGSLVSKLGITNLVVLYVITTILGGTLLLLQHSRMTKLYKLLGDSASENMSEELKAENK